MTSDDALWAATVDRYLKAPLWTGRHAYDAGHLLQVPLHHAFARDRPDRQERFAAHFRRFLAADHGVIPAGAPLDRLQYLYLASRFAALAHRAGRADLVPDGLVALLHAELDRLWLREPAWVHGSAPLPGGVSRRVRWKLDRRRRVPHRYHRAVSDQDLYPMAIAADLRQIRGYGGHARDATAAVRDALAQARRVFDRLVAPTAAGGWVLQPGAWADHPDYAYAGRHRAGARLRPAPVDDIAQDTSHAHRLPLWLTSLAEAYPAGSAARARYGDLRRRLAAQFVGAVLVPPTPRFPAHRTTNYLDGRNGLYRWGYRTAGGGGYRPYELSGTLTLGWWSFLGTPETDAVHREQAAAFPLPARVVRTYLGPDTTRRRHPLVAGDAPYRDGLALLLARLAADRTDSR